MSRRNGVVVKSDPPARRALKVRRGPSGKISRDLSERQSCDSSRARASVGSLARKAAFAAPIEVPTRTSGTMCRARGGLRAFRPGWLRGSRLRKERKRSRRLTLDELPLGERLALEFEMEI
jgi:hypothetical protein